jgi:hypothetical protein
MLTDKDIETKQTTFTKSDDGCWYDAPAWDYQIRRFKGKLAFFKHCEVAGDTQLLCEQIKDIEHLKFLYEEMSGEEFDKEY